MLVNLESTVAKDACGHSTTAQHTKLAKNPSQKTHFRQLETILIPQPSIYRLQKQKCQTTWTASKHNPTAPKSFPQYTQKTHFRQSETFMADPPIDIKNMCNRARLTRGSQTTTRRE
jgi:hypothetical protein